MRRTVMTNLPRAGAVALIGLWLGWGEVVLDQPLWQSTFLCLVAGIAIACLAAERASPLGVVSGSVAALAWAAFVPLDLPLANAGFLMIVFVPRAAVAGDVSRSAAVWFLAFFGSILANGVVAVGLFLDPVAAFVSTAVATVLASVPFLIGVEDELFHDLRRLSRGQLRCSPIRRALDLKVGLDRFSGTLTAEEVAALHRALEGFVQIALVQHHASAQDDPRLYRGLNEHLSSMERLVEAAGSRRVLESCIETAPSVAGLDAQGLLAEVEALSEVADEARVSCSPAPEA